MSAIDILKQQRDVLRRMLLLNEPMTPVDSLQWKVLIFDHFSRDVLAPLLNVGELRKLGVTLHLMIDQPRDRVADAPAIYFTTPSEENISMIVEDVKKGLYDAYHLNFTSSIPRSLLEKLAAQTCESNAAHRISRVFDQYCHFVSLEAQLFTLNIAQSFALMNSPSSSDSAQQNFVNAIVDGLFSICASMSCVPIIRCIPGSAAEMIASLLDDRIRNQLTSKNNVFVSQFDDTGFSSKSNSLQRPVLIVAERSMDIAVPLHHPWTYQALLHDVLQMKANRIKISDEVSEKSKVDAKPIDLDCSDPFFSRLAGLPFPKVAEAVEEAIQEYQKDMSEINKKTGGADAVDPTMQNNNPLGGLASAIDMIPKLQEKKKRIDVHMNLATAVLNHVKKRELDSFFTLEEMLLTRGAEDRSSLMSLIGKDAKGTAEDKMRLFLIYFLSNSSSISASDFEQFESALKASSIDLSPLSYVKSSKWTHSNSSVAADSSSASSVARGLFDNLLDRGAGLFAGVKNILPVSKDLPMTKVVDCILHNKASPETDNFLYFDPKLPKKSSRIRPKQMSAFSEAILFVVGGGNYVEFQNLQEYVANGSSGSGLSVLYGATEMVSPTEFLSQLAALGREGASKK